MMENITRERALELLNAPERLDNLRKLVKDARDGLLPLPVTTRDTNNHIHTTYSFSPYSPTAAVWFAWQAGLCTAGIMDHDSIAGAHEFIEACEICGIGGTVGIELRLVMRGTPFEKLRINNPDQNGCMYTAMHAVPHNMVDKLNDFLAPYRAKRNDRNRKMVAAVNELMAQYSIAIDFDRDVLPLSEYAVGGTVTERHISRALSEKMIEVTGGGAALVRFIKDTLKLPIPEKIELLISDDDNPHMMYDLLGWIKSELISKFYVDADEELLNVEQFIALAREINAISAQAYLGDVIGASVTGDKKTQTFEDPYLDELIDYNKNAGYQALTYGPSRNNGDQIRRLKALCDKYGLLQISGEDINTPRQSFICMAQRGPEFANLYDAAWALIAHERLATKNPEGGMFSKSSVERWPDIAERVRAFSEVGRELCNFKG